VGLSPEKMATSSSMRIILELAGLSARVPQVLRQ
jgi:hypothetical protein